MTTENEEGLVLRSGDSQSFTEMRKAQKADMESSQAAVKKTLPSDQLKPQTSDKEQALGVPGPKMTPGQKAKQRWLERREHRGLKPVEEKPIPKVAPNKAAPKKAAPKKAAPKKAAPKKAAPKKAAPKKAAPKKKTVSKKK